MKTLKQAIVGIMTAVLLLALVIVNIEVGLNDGTNSEISLLGAEITFIETAFAQSTEPGEEESNLSCDDLSNCNDGAGCTSTGVMKSACVMECDGGPRVECGVKD